MKKNIMLNDSSALHFAMDVTKLAVENGVFNNLGGSSDYKANEVADFYETFLNRISSNEE